MKLTKTQNYILHGWVSNYRRLFNDDTIYLHWVRDQYSDKNWVEAEASVEKYRLLAEEREPLLKLYYKVCQEIK